MIELWSRLKDHLSRTFPAALQSLNPPVTDEQLARAERKLGFTLPGDLKESLLVHDGQPQITGFPPTPIPLIPSTEAATWGLFAPLDLIVQVTKPYNQTDWSEFGCTEFDGPVRQEPPWQMVVFVDPGSGDVLAMDLNPASEGNRGQVLAINHDPSQLIVLAPSYRDWFEELVKRYESGRYVIQNMEGMPSSIDLEQR